MRPRLVHAWLAPTVAWLVSRGVFSWAALTSDVDPWDRAAWIRSDSGHYLSIAERGYELLSCHEYRIRSPNDFCGNTAWFPGYSLLVRASAWLFGSGNGGLERAAVTLAPLFFLGVLWVIRNRFLGAGRTRNAVALLALAALFPGSVYFHAAYPLSLFVLCVLLISDGIARERLRQTLAFGFLAGLSYSAAPFAAVGLGAHALLKLKDRSRRARDAFVASLAIGAGVISTFALQTWQTGESGAFFKTQSKYGYGSGYPLQAIARAFGLHDSRHYQTLSVCAVGLALTTASFWSAWKSKSWRGRSAVSLMTAALWCGPLLLGGALSLHRTEATLVPAVSLLERWPRALVWMLAIASSIISYSLAKLFFLDRII